MTIRSKTIGFITTTNTASVAANTWTSGSLEMFIPETIEDFVSVAVTFHFASDEVTTIDLDDWSCSIGTTETFTTSQSVYVTDANQDSQEKETFHRELNFVNFFNDNWSGTTNTWWLKSYAQTKPTNNYFYKVLITYNYDDTSTTHIKTIRIPIESTRSILTPSWVTIGGATAIPALGGSYLPESDVVIRQAALELYANENRTSVVGATITQLRINGGTAHSLWIAPDNTSLSNVSAGRTMVIGLDITSEITAAAISLEAQSLVNKSTNFLGGWILVTYEFTPATTTTVYNSLFQSAFSNNTYVGIASPKRTLESKIFINVSEPGPITLKESALHIVYIYPSAQNPVITIGEQSAITYGVTTGSTHIMGNWGFTHRIDGGGTGSLWYSNFNTGSNPLEISFVGQGNPGITSPSAFTILNYTSATSSFGIGAHTSPRYYSLITSSNIHTAPGYQYGGMPITESTYYAEDIIIYHRGEHDGQNYINLHFDCYIGVEEIPLRAGWWNLTTFSGRLDAENYEYIFIDTNSNFYKKYPEDPDGNLILIDSSSEDRQFTLYTGDVNIATVGAWISYNTYDFTITGSITGFSGTVKLDLIDPSGSKILKTTTIVGDGPYSFTWPHPYTPLYVSANDGTNVGRSTIDFAQDS